MRILYFSFVELDLPNACQEHTLGILSGFGKNECKVDAVVPYPKNIIPNIMGVQFFYIRPWRFSNFGRLWVKLIGGLYFFILCLLKKYDAIYVREFEKNPFPRWCSKIFKIPYYIEINGIQLLNLNVSHKGINYLNRIERNQRLDYNWANGLIVTSFPRSQWVINHFNLRPNKVYTIINGTKIPQNKKLCRKVSLKSLNLPEEGFYLGFLGNIWKHYDIETIIKGISLCRRLISNLCLIVIGEGPQSEHLIKRAIAEGIISKIINLGFVQPRGLYRIMGAVDLGLMNLTAEGLRDLGPVTTRFATYASYKIPVIANKLYLENYPEEIVKGLFSIPHEDPQAFADMIYWLYRHPDERRYHADIIYNFVAKKLTWEVIAKRIFEIIISSNENEYYGKCRKK
jgi:glycosyltransferase involved in cell wall biosynthesis